jgi:hypothetical protein
MSSAASVQAATPFPGINSSSKFLIYYGNDFTSTNLNLMKTFDVVVLDPNQSNCTPAVIAYLQNNGVKDVIGYISIGEDAASVTSSTGAIVGDGLGPVYCNTTTKAITYENRGVASFYVDQAWNSTTSSYVEDNAPDTNPGFGG